MGRITKYTARALLCIVYIHGTVYLGRNTHGAGMIHVYSPPRADTQYTVYCVLSSPAFNRLSFTGVQGFRKLNTVRKVNTKTEPTQ